VDGGDRDAVTRLPDDAGKALNHGLRRGGTPLPYRLLRAADFFAPARITVSLRNGASREVGQRRPAAPHANGEEKGSA